MFEISVVGHFSSAHFLRGYRGKCENLHGHNWKVEAVFCGRKLNTIGILLDFVAAREMVRDVIAGLDHVNLNEIGFFKTHNPSSENIAFYIYRNLKKRVKKFKQASIARVKIWEQAGSCAVYDEK